MTWVKLEDDVTLHPKILRLSDGAFRLWTHGLAFANRGVTDGRIDKALVPSLNHHGRWTPKQLAGFIAELVPGLWLDAGDHYEIHDYAHHQYEATKERVERKREVDREKQRRKREKDDARQRESLGMSPGDKRGDTTNHSPGETSVPARPVPISPSERERDARAPEAPRQPIPKHVGRFLDSLDPDRPTTEQLRLVASMFSAHRKSAGAGGWAWDGKTHGSTYEALVRIARVLSDESDPDACFASAMRGFLADAKARDAGFPLAFLAHDLGRYEADGLKLTPSKPVDLDRQRRIVELARQSNDLREQGQRAFEERGDRAERSRLVAESERLAQECERLKRQA